LNAIESREISASVWGEKLYGSGFLVRWLKKGDRFTWPLDKKEIPQVYVYKGRGWYSREGDQRCFRTGVFRCCNKLEDK
jgi:hypothetical protein